MPASVTEFAITTHRDQQWKYALQNFCGLRFLFKKHGGEFWAKLLRRSQKKSS